MNRLREKALGAPPRPAPELSDDLESFYWLLVWMILRRGGYILRKDIGPFQLSTLFPAHPRYTAALNAKMAWLQKNSIRVPNDRPLSTLLNEFRILCIRNVVSWSSDDHPRVPLTHEAVLAIFNKALDAKNWPEAPLGFGGRGAGNGAGDVGAAPQNEDGSGPVAKEEPQGPSV